MTGRKSHHKWKLDYTYNANKQSNMPAPAGEFQLPATDLDSNDPVAYQEKVAKANSVVSKDAKPTDIEKLTIKKSWDIALAPIKQVPMNLFIMWMSGNTISIFPIMMVGMMFFRPIQALFNYSQTFSAIQGSLATLQKFVYCLGNGLCVLLAVYKCQGMGLLPTHPSDWLAFEEPQQRMEWSGGGVVL